MPIPTPGFSFLAYQRHLKSLTFFCAKYVVFFFLFVDPTYDDCPLTHEHYRAWLLAGS